MWFRSKALQCNGMVSKASFTDDYSTVLSSFNSMCGHPRFRVMPRTPLALCFSSETTLKYIGNSRNWYKEFHARTHLSRLYFHKSQVILKLYEFVLSKVVFKNIICCHGVHTSTNPTMVTQRSRSWSWMVDLHHFRSMLIGHPIPKIRLF